MYREHRVPCFCDQFTLAEAAYLEKIGVIKWVSGPVRDDEDTWLTDAYYIIKNQRAYDKFIRLLKNIFEKLRDDGDRRPNWIYLLHIQKKLKRFRRNNYAI